MQRGDDDTVTQDVCLVLGALQSICRILEGNCRLEVLRLRHLNRDCIKSIVRAFAKNDANPCTLKGGNVSAWCDGLSAIMKSGNVREICLFATSRRHRLASED